jgi:ABC-type multidrug transport system fused ATPase/permease subunit
VFRLRCIVFDRVQRLSLAFHDSTTVGDSLYRVTWDSYAAQSLFNEGLVPVLNSAVTLGGAAIILFNRDWTLAVTALIASLPLVALIRIADRSMSSRSMAVHERESEVTVRVQETLSGIRAVQAFGREDDESARFRHRAEASVKASLRLTLAQTLFQSAVAIFMASGTALVIWIAASRGLRGSLSPGDVVLVAAYVAMFYKPIEMLAYTASAIQQAAAGARRVLTLLEVPQEVEEAPGAAPLPANVKGAIEMQGVTFSYREGHPVLRDIRLSISPGSKVALVGPSGAGKTTLVSLLLRFYDAPAGTITIDGRDIRKLTLRSLRENIAFVPQEPVLFGTTVRENIAYGRPSASSAEIEAAARAAAAHDFIAALPGAYDTPVGENGVLLSGGQCQRISLARAFLKNAPILIMDEPTSALDAESEQAILMAVQRLASGRTTITIAHRLSTIRNADVIVVMKEGQIVESGSHEALLRNGRVYPRFYELQFGAPAPAVSGREI